MRMPIINKVRQHVDQSRLMELRSTGLSSNETVDRALREACAKCNVPFNFSDIEMNVLREWILKQF